MSEVILQGQFCLFIKGGKRARQSRKNKKKLGRDGAVVVEDMGLKVSPPRKKVRAGQGKPAGTTLFKLENAKVYVNAHTRTSPRRKQDGGADTLEGEGLNP